MSVELYVALAQRQWRPLLQTISSTTRWLCHSTLITASLSVRSYGTVAVSNVYILYLTKLIDHGRDQNLGERAMVLLSHGPADPLSRNYVHINEAVQQTPLQEEQQQFAASNPAKHVDGHDQFYRHMPQKQPPKAKILATTEDAEQSVKPALQ
ncbi:hypothetical protein F442_23027 [Phytophthora nicotianae P10297]|uniref:Uncharacterized protein n=1 Tax=Phytophthora nicotianae P10297 TaxID=1317064 RepID=W2XZ95_PHYNI|nr:hypothetical protein F442_23027 [Phytophthora nicotianae P10297]